MTSRAATLVLALAIAATASAEVFVEPATVIVKEDTSVAAGNYTYFELTLNKGVELAVSLSVTGGVDNTLRHWLIDLANFLIHWSQVRSLHGPPIH